MSDKQKGSSGQSRTETIKAATISGALTVLASMIMSLVGFVAALLDLTQLKIPAEYLTVIAVVVSIFVVLSLSFYVAVNFYIRQSLQTKMAIETLKGKESRLFQDIEIELSSLINEKVP
jgi:hypothetical protein